MLLLSINPSLGFDQASGDSKMRCTPKKEETSAWVSDRVSSTPTMSPCYSMYHFLVSPDSVYIEIDMAVGWE